MRGQHHAPATLYPGKDPVPTLQEAGWAPGPVWTGAENLAPTGIRSPVRPAHSESLYRLRNPGQWCYVGVGGKNYVLAALPMGKGPSNCGTGGWMGPRASLEVCGGANFLPTSGLKPQNAQLTAVHYTGYAVPIPLELISVKN